VESSLRHAALVALGHLWIFEVEAGEARRSSGFAFSPATVLEEAAEILGPNGPREKASKLVADTARTSPDMIGDPARLAAVFVESGLKFDKSRRPRGVALCPAHRADEHGGRRLLQRQGHGPRDLTYPAGPALHPVRAGRYQRHPAEFGGTGLGLAIPTAPGHPDGRLDRRGIHRRRRTTFWFTIRSTVSAEISTPPATPTAAAHLARQRPRR